MNKIKVTVWIVISGIALIVLSAQSVSAIDVWGGCSGGSSGEVCGAAGTDDVGSTMQNVINAMIFLLGIAAIIMIIVGGFKYITSNGDASKVKSAKDTIMYSVIGLVVAILSFAIVQFVLDRV